MKKFLFFAIAILSLTSCGSGDPKREFSEKRTFISRIFAEGSSDISFTEGAYTLTLDLINLKANITAHNAKIPGLA